MIEGLIVAAGKSERTGNQYKMTLDFFGRTMLETTIYGMAPFCPRIIVVVGHKAEQLTPLLKNTEIFNERFNEHFNKRPEMRLEIIFNPNYTAGMYSSVKQGLQQIRARRFFFLPGDCPLIPGSVYEEMLKTDANIVVPTFNGQPGHPVLLKKTMAEKILNRPEYNNLRDFIRSNEPHYLAVPSADILFDVDTLADYHQALSRLGEND